MSKPHISDEDFIRAIFESKTFKDLEEKTGLKSAYSKYNNIKKDYPNLKLKDLRLPKGKKKKDPKEFTSLFMKIAKEYETDTKKSSNKQPAK